MCCEEGLCKMRVGICLSWLTCHEWTLPILLPAKTSPVLNACWFNDLIGWPPHWFLIIPETCVCFHCQHKKPSNLVSELTEASLKAGVYAKHKLFLFKKLTPHFYEAARRKKINWLIEVEIISLSTAYYLLAGVIKLCCCSLMRQMRSHSDCLCRVTLTCFLQDNIQTKTC